MSLLFQFDSHCTAEVSPVCAIVGGIVGQEVVKVTNICFSSRTL